MQGEKDTQGYRSIFKATGLFGGVQVLSIIASVIKTKLVAVWLGTAGFGIISIFNSSLTLISSLTNLGLQSSAVRDIAVSTNDEEKLAKAVGVTNKLAILTSILGAVITIVLAPLLSVWFFKSNEFVIQFIILSLAVLFTGLYNQFYAVMQGTRYLKFLAKSSVIGVFLGLFVSLPFFYYLKEAGIIWAIVLSVLISMLVSFFYVKKIPIGNYQVTFKESIIHGIETIKLGIYIALSNNVAYLVQFLLKAFISNNGGVEQVGLFQSGWQINAMYVGLIFTAMAKDYYPRLCQNINDNNEIEKKVVEQGEIGLLLLAPMIAFMITFINIVITLLYTDEFLSIAPMTVLLLIGTIIQVASWGLGYVFLAKSDGKIYFFNEVVTKLLLLPLYLFGYKYLGLTGLGYAFIANQIIYYIWISFVSKRRYGVRYPKSFFKLFLLLILISIILGWLEINVHLGLFYKLLIAISIAAYTIYELNKRIDLLSYIKRRRN